MHIVTSTLVNHTQWTQTKNLHASTNKPAHLHAQDNKYKHTYHISNGIDLRPSINNVQFVGVLIGLYDSLRERQTDTQYTTMPKQLHQQAHLDVFLIILIALHHGANQGLATPGYGCVRHIVQPRQHLQILYRTPVKRNSYKVGQ